MNTTSVIMIIGVIVLIGLAYFYLSQGTAGTQQVNSGYQNNNNQQQGGDSGTIGLVSSIFNLLAGVGQSVAAGYNSAGNNNSNSGGNNPYPVGSYEWSHWGQ